MSHIISRADGYRSVRDADTGEELGWITEGSRDSNAYSLSCRFDHTLWDAHLEDGRVAVGFWYQVEAAEWVEEAAAIPRDSDPDATYGAKLPAVRWGYAGVIECVRGGRGWMFKADDTRAWVPRAAIDAAARAAERSVATATERGKTMTLLAGAPSTADMRIGGVPVALVAVEPVPGPRQRKMLTRARFAVPLDRPWTVAAMRTADTLGIDGDRIAAATLRDVLQRLPADADISQVTTAIRDIAPTEAAA